MRSIFIINIFHYFAIYFSFHFRSYVVRYPANCCKILQKLVKIRQKDVKNDVHFETNMLYCIIQIKRILDEG